MTSVSKHTRSEVFNVDMERGYKGESAWIYQWANHGFH
jgi:hypothetical protein